MGGNKVNLKLQKIKNENLLHVFIKGEIDIYTTPILKGELELIDLSNGLIIELDLSNVTFMDSSGLGLLLGFYKKINKENTSLILINPSAKVTRMFNITGLSQFIDIEIRKGNIVGV